MDNNGLLKIHSSCILYKTRLYRICPSTLDTRRRSSAWESTRPGMFRSEAEDRAVVSSNLTDGTLTSILKRNNKESVCSIY